VRSAAVIGVLLLNQEEVKEMAVAPSKGVGQMLAWLRLGRALLRHVLLAAAPFLLLPATLEKRVP
jgi:hypothetical protein